MRVLSALVGAAAALAGSAFARAIPNAGVTNIASANEASPDNYTCGYAWTEHNMLGEPIRLPAWQVVTHKYMKYYSLSPNCACRFWDDEGGLVIGSGSEGDFSPKRDMIYAGCWHDGHSGHLETKGFEVNGMEAKGMEAKDLAGTVNEASPDIIYCGYVYTGYNLQGFSNGLVPWRNTKAYVKSYNISGACLCTFRIGEPGRESTPVVLKGPIQGNLDDKAFNVLCEQGGGPPPSIKRGDTGDLAVAASASVEPFNCGYVSAEQGQRGDSVRLPLGAYSWIPGKTLQSYRITGNCHCAFRRNVPIPGVADVTGPLTGDLKVAYETAICERSFSSKRDEPQDLAATIASAPVLAKEDAVQCGYAYSEHSLRGKQVSLPGDGSKVYYEIINSYVISGECLCTFASKPGAVPENVHDIKGPGQGEIYIDAASVVCRMV